MQDLELQGSSEAAIQSMAQQAPSPTPKLRSTFQLMQPVRSATAPACIVRGISKKRRQEDEKKILQLSVKNYGISPRAEQAFSYPCLLGADLQPTAGFTCLSGSLPNITSNAIIPLSLSSLRELCITLAPSACGWEVC